MKTKIKTIDITAKEWVDKVNGNSYFSARITINYCLKDEITYHIPFEYGYEDHYKYVALEKLVKEGLLLEGTEKYIYNLREMNIITRFTKHENCLKRDVIKWGIEN